MKILTLLTALCSLQAQAGSYETVLDRKMPLAQCNAAIKSYASTAGLTLEAWGENDYYLNQDGEKVGNAYYSEGTCYIYLNQ